MSIFVKTIPLCFVFVLCACQRLNLDVENNHYKTNQGSAEWQQWLDYKIQGPNIQGHGPDVGSSEWCQMVEFKLFKGKSRDIPCSERWNDKVMQKLAL